MAYRSAVVASIALFGSAAHAEPVSSEWTSAAGPEGRVFMRQVVAAAASPTSGLARSRTIYMNHHGATLSPGNNNSQSQTSSVVGKVSQVSGWDATPEQWGATMACMQQIWSRFDVAITDVDPGTTPHIEALFGGSPTEVGLPENVGGISPFTSDCSVIEHSIVFAFTDNLPKQPRLICEIMSQEIAHSYGLDHELLPSDPMTYLAYGGDREFQDSDADCGEKTPRACGVSGKACRPTQNSFQLLLARLGPSGRDNQPPSIGITAPSANATVDAGFAISATATDNVAVKSVAFYLDGALLATRTVAPYELATDASVTRGAHTIVVEAADADGNVATMERDIVVASGADPASESDSLGLGCTVGGQPAFALIGVAAGFVVRRRRRAAAT